MKTREMGEAFKKMFSEEAAAEVEVPADGWWITTGLQRDGGARLLGPFVSRDLALRARVYVEKFKRTDQLWVVEVRDGKDVW